jgi:hypothetical protein
MGGTFDDAKTWHASAAVRWRENEEERISSPI